MARKLYGSMCNRFDENKKFVEEIKVGTGVTMYYWSDRHAYEVVKVINQQNVVIREYDHKSCGGAFSNDWKLISNPKNAEKEIKLRYGKWNYVNRYTKEWIEQQVAKCENCTNPEAEYNYIVKFCARLNDVEIEKINKGQEVVKYRPIDCGISFGVADYYFDYEF